ncbi:MAG: hypothetical protein OHK0028_17580 [Deltaproteobacteria bacterium]
MKKGLIIGALGFALFGSAAAGFASAGGQETEAASQPGFISLFQAQAAMETGAVTVARDAEPVGGAVLSGEEGFPIIDNGGVRFRGGLDTGA